MRKLILLLTCVLTGCVSPAEGYNHIRIERQVLMKLTCEKVTDGICQKVVIEPLTKDRERSKVSRNLNKYEFLSN